MNDDRVADNGDYPRRPWGSKGYPPLHEALWDEADDMYYRAHEEAGAMLRDAGDEIVRLRAALEDIANSATGDSVVDSVAHQAERALNE